jgi:hypothetical protein
MTAAGKLAVLFLTRQDLAMIAESIEFSFAVSREVAT